MSDDMQPMDVAQQGNPGASQTQDPGWLEKLSALLQQLRFKVDPHSAIGQGVARNEYADAVGSADTDPQGANSALQAWQDARNGR